MEEGAQIAPIQERRISSPLEVLGSARRVRGIAADIEAVAEAYDNLLKNQEELMMTKEASLGNVREAYHLRALALDEREREKAASELRREEEKLERRIEGISNRLQQEYDLRQRGLEKEMSEEFMHLVEAIGPLVSPWRFGEEEEGAEILDYEVLFLPETRKFYIHITEIETPRGKIGDARSDLEKRTYMDYLIGIISEKPNEAYPKVAEFKRRLGVESITPPKLYDPRKERNPKTSI